MLRQEVPLTAWPAGKEPTHLPPSSAAAWRQHPEGLQCGPSSEPLPAPARSEDALTKAIKLSQPICLLPLSASYCRPGWGAGCQQQRGVGSPSTPLSHHHPARLPATRSELISSPINHFPLELGKALGKCGLEQDFVTKATGLARESWAGSRHGLQAFCPSWRCHSRCLLWDEGK